MYCPNCGKDNSNEQRFCRSCGLSLQTISQVLVSELSATKLDNDLIAVEKQEPKKWHNPLMYGLLMLILGLTIIFFGRTVLGEQLIADIGTVIAFLGVIIFGYKGISLMFPNSANVVLPQSNLMQGLVENEQTNKLTPATQFEGLSSVTEHTTRHLEPIYSERKSE